MTKILELELERPQYTTVRVEVPDDFNLDQIYSCWNRKAVKHAVDQIQPFWEDDLSNENIEVESAKEIPPTTPWMVVNITQPLAECAAELAEIEKRATTRKMVNVVMEIVDAGKMPPRTSEEVDDEPARE